MKEKIKAIRKPSGGNRASADMKIGSIHQTKNNGDVKVLEYINSVEIRVKFINTGFVKLTTAAHIRSGNVGYQRKHTIHTPEDLIVGSIHQTNNHGSIEVLQYHNTSKVDVEFINTGYKTTTAVLHIRSGELSDLSQPKTRNKNLKQGSKVGDCAKRYNKQNLVPAVTNKEVASRLAKQATQLHNTDIEYNLSINKQIAALKKTYVEAINVSVINEQGGSITLTIVGTKDILEAATLAVKDGKSTSIAFDPERGYFRETTEPNLSYLMYINNHSIEFK